VLLRTSRGRLIIPFIMEYLREDGSDGRDLHTGVEAPT
jgi:hypothetical protein